MSRDVKKGAFCLPFSSAFFCISHSYSLFSGWIIRTTESLLSFSFALYWLSSVVLFEGRMRRVRMRMPGLCKIMVKKALVIGLLLWSGVRPRPCAEMKWDSETIWFLLHHRLLHSCSSPIDFLTWGPHMDRAVVKETRESSWSLGKEISSDDSLYCCYSHSHPHFSFAPWPSCDAIALAIHSYAFVYSKAAGEFMLKNISIWTINPITTYIVLFYSAGQVVV